MKKITEKSLCCGSQYKQQFWGTSKTYRCDKCNKRCRIGFCKSDHKVLIPFYGHAQIVNAVKKNTK